MLIGTGVDIVHIQRFRKIAEKWDGRFLNRIFTPAEIIYCNKKVDKIQHLAARFACKEAISKALKMTWNKGLSWRDIAIINNHNGEPKALLTGQAKEVADGLKVGDIQLSLSHCPEYAVATAAIVMKGREANNKCL